MHILKHQHTFQQESALLVNVSLAEELIQIKVSYLMKNNESIGEDLMMLPNSIWGAIIEFKAITGQSICKFSEDFDERKT